MAIKMVREPSETPNINNIDDIVPMRYAYGGQNGYVIAKGTEISNTVNGLNFTINSGRLVLQGVECDIDASGVTISIDNIATKRYYTIYLEVNLGLNTTSIKSEYDTATYPTIDSGDDLTENSTGIANLSLYQFTAQNGVISDVNKVVKEISYPLNDYDITKGTVEERLTNLGFKQGSFSISLKTGAAPQITTNSIIRQGNYCIGSFDIGLVGIGVQTYIDDYNVIIPEAFRPLTDTTITCFQTRGGISGIGYDTAILKTTGEVVFSGLDASLNTATAINIGWEAAPIS